MSKAWTGEVVEKERGERPRRITAKDGTGRGRQGLCLSTEKAVFLLFVNIFLIEITPPTPRFFSLFKSQGLEWPGQFSYETGHSLSLSFQ